MQLSVQRAEKVLDYLASEFSVDRARLTAAGFGHTRQVAYNTSMDGRQQNQRVHIVFDFPDRM